MMKYILIFIDFVFGHFKGRYPSKSVDFTKRARKSHFQIELRNGEHTFRRQKKVFLNKNEPNIKLLCFQKK